MQVAHTLDSLHQSWDEKRDICCATSWLVGGGGTRAMVGAIRRGSSTSSGRFQGPL